MKHLVMAVLGVMGSVAMAQAPAPAPFVTHQLKPNIYWVEGGGGNSTVIVGNTGVIVVDAKTTETGGKALLAEIAKITPKPVTTVFLSHSDGDHANGLAAFPAGVKVIAQENCKKELEAAFAAKTPPTAIGPEHIPSVVVTRPHESMTIDGVKLDLYHWAPAHTSGDLVVYLPAEKILATGDIVAMNNGYPRIHDEKNGSSMGWLTTAKGIVAIKAEILIPGHGSVITNADLEKRIADATQRRDETIKLAKQGKSLEEVKTAVGDADKLNYKSWTEIVYSEAKK